MSENSEHSPDDTETETKAMEELPNDSSKSEAKLMMNQTGAALLEDEEMPTYISVSSTTRPDDSDGVNVKQSENESQEVERERSSSPYHSDDQAPSSVYVLSSEEETDQHPYNDEDDEDDYGESDEMENLELDHEFDSEHPSKHLMDDEDDDDEDDEEEEEDDEDSPRQMHNIDDGMDDNYEPDCYEGRSDDFVLNKRLKNQDKEKSLSLQDLNTYKNTVNAEYFKRRRVLRPNYVSIPEAAIYSLMQRKQSMPGKYHHVQSKVKRYIRDIKEQNKRSLEKHMKQLYQDEMMYSKGDTDHKNIDAEKIKPTVANKTIKDYAERTIKELEIAETCDSNVATKATYNATTSPIILNGQDNKNCLESIHEESIVQNEVEINMPFESAQNERDLINTDNKAQKQNGTIDVKSLKYNYPDKEISHFPPSSLIQNGHQEVPTVLYNLRTLSYEEYMHGTSDSSQKIDLNRNAHVIEQEHGQPEAYNADLMDISTDNEDTCPLRIENIKSIKTMSEEAKNNNEQLTFEKTNEELKTTLDPSEVTTLKRKLTQKTAKYNSLLDTYQKQLMENLKMKQELDELRKTLVKYEKENKPPEQREVSIQTDIIIDSASNQHQDQTEPVQQSNNKISGSSVASTLSSIDQWSSSACNLSLSMKPPEVTKALQSDDSVVLTDGTPAKTTRSLSRAFITSSRILQTLSSITHGKTKPESPLVQNSKKRLNENVSMDLQNDDSNYQCLPSSSKKRKITDILPPSNFLQPFKAFPSSAESHAKLNETPNTEAQLKNLYDSVNKNVDLQASSSNANTSQLRADTSTMESKMETSNDPEDNVKCFVYREDDNSKDRSFLILAEEPEKDKVLNEKGRIRECGPYLLGNVEVRMSEINGTINIWGKEISQESTAETENDTETSTKVKDKNYHCWQKTPYTKFNGNNLVCSTSKKSKSPPKFDLSSATSNSCLQSPSFNIAKASCSTDKADKLYSHSSACEDCDLSKHCKESLRYKRTLSQEKLHSCCIHNIDMSEQKGNCSLHKERQKFEDSFNCSKERLSTQEHRQSFSRNLGPNKHLHENNIAEDNEHMCRNCTTCHHAPHNSENYQESHKCCDMLKEACEPLVMNTDREYNESCNHSSSHIHEEEPLITLKQCSETPETRRRRSTGKRVRGILMDLIRGCGDCYNHNVSRSSKSCMHKKLKNCSPQIKISPCTSAEPSYSNPGQPVGRCCHAYAQRIESQLEEFRMEMERMRSRSDAILNMLNMLHSVDTN
ncbi:PREDICTED: kinesin-related protein 4-like [Wasmannia auropunctata]|uniref:kinesin-related protein 4-like n=1 Tax=Wasmannia auropunctata TaxID=64793 RepID=UPI0005EFC8BB|nr:PREDICTED: kinesin-related protein 4-like [Wasmannia auropunctata]XP_011703879.1 PREDICTED: kinesin-related protein 4-like [Wasmannia auropunctata]XP_011703880.1 PREDICTED: kinesin-related protein 4-like [Wasmannia auropunctata]